MPGDASPGGFRPTPGPRRWRRDPGERGQYREIHETVMKTSPNYFNISRPIRIDATLEVQ